MDKKPESIQKEKRQGKKKDERLYFLIPLSRTFIDTLCFLE
jgi:hypothetical protein